MEGFYESLFERANHPTRPLAFWTRYTLFSPAAHPEAAEGELWAAFFNGETGVHVARCERLSLRDCRFSLEEGPLRLGALGEFGFGHFFGHLGADLRWDLSISGGGSPLFLLDPRYYRTRFPAAKSMTPLPIATFNGYFEVKGERVAIEAWQGSVGHNWGPRHTDRYAFAQIAGFDQAPETYFEMASAQFKWGPLYTPSFTPFVLCHRGEVIRVGGPLDSLRVKSRRQDSLSEGVEWRFSARTGRYRVEGVLSAPARSFVHFPYRNPPGGVKHCFNTKIGSAEIRLTDTRSGRVEPLSTASRAAIEILSDRDRL